MYFFLRSTFFLWCMPSCDIFILAQSFRLVQLFSHTLCPFLCDFSALCVFRSHIRPALPFLLHQKAYRIPIRHTSIHPSCIQASAPAAHKHPSQLHTSIHLRLQPASALASEHLGLPDSCFLSAFYSQNLTQFESLDSGRKTQGKGVLVHIIHIIHKEPSGRASFSPGLKTA